MTLKIESIPKRESNCIGVDHVMPSYEIVYIPLVMMTNLPLPYASAVTSLTDVKPSFVGVVQLIPSVEVVT